MLTFYCSDAQNSHVHPCPLKSSFLNIILSINGIIFKSPNITDETCRKEPSILYSFDIPFIGRKNYKLQIRVLRISI